MSKIDEILEGYKNGQLTYIDREGEHKIDVKEFVKTGSDNVLQKLNRTEHVLLKVANAAPEKLKWVNDYAMMKVINELYERVDDLNASLIAKDTEIERLNNEAAASRVSFETNDGISKEEAEKFIERIKELETNDQTIHTQLNQIIAERDELNEKYAVLDERFNKSVEAYKTLKSEKDSLDTLVANMSKETETSYNNLVTDYDKLNAEYKNKTDEINNLKGDIESLKTRLENTTEDNLKLNDKITELKQMKTDIEQKLNSCNKELDNEYGKQKDLNDLIVKLKEKYNETWQELNGLKESFDEATGQIRNLDSTNVELQNKINEQANLIAGLNATIESTNNEKIELQDSLEEKTKENALLVAKIRNSENDTERLKMFESAINEMLSSIGWNVDTKKQAEQTEQSNAMHRMGDNQVVDFNIGA
jgi:chromosome segregation ATPase